MAKYRWVKKDQLLRREADGANIPWPPQESEGFKAKMEIDAGEAVDPEVAEVPIERDELNNLDRTLKAFALVIAEVSGRSPSQIRALFKEKYNSLG